MGDGFCTVDKPAGMTSHDVVARIRRLAHTRRVGHAGTLDPDATGVLVVALNRATRLLRFFEGTSKAYQATVRFGIATDSEDASGRVISRGGVSADFADRFPTVLADFTGDIDQIPSALSALKIGGKRAYELFRSGEEVKLAPRQISIFELSTQPPQFSRVEGTEVADVSLVVECSKGTYIRALARDLGNALGCGAHLIQLRRTRVGSFHLADAQSLEEIEAHGLRLLDLGEICSRLGGVVEVDEAQEWALRHGQPIDLVEKFDKPVGARSANSGKIVAVIVERDGKMWPKVGLEPA